jgi:hypothetical protein
MRHEMCFDFIDNLYLKQLFVTKEDLGKNPQYRISTKSGQWEQDCSLRMARESDRRDKVNSRISQCVWECPKKPTKFNVSYTSSDVSPLYTLGTPHREI